MCYLVAPVPLPSVGTYVNMLLNFNFRNKNTLPSGLEYNHRVKECFLILLE